MIIKNMQSEPIKINIGNNNENIVIYGQENFRFETDSNSRVVIKISHCILDNGIKSPTDRIINSVAKATILVVDSLYMIDKIEESASIEIYNDVCEFKKYDFGYLFFRLNSTACSCKVLDYCGSNIKNVLNSRKILYLGELFDFFPFSFVRCMKHYRKIKRLCNDKNIMMEIERKNKMIQ